MSPRSWFAKIGTLGTSYAYQLIALISSGLAIYRKPIVGDEKVSFFELEPYLLPKTFSIDVNTPYYACWIMGQLVDTILKV